MAKKILPLFPMLIAAVCVLGLLAWNERIIHVIAEQNVNLGELYAAVFDWSSIQTGFLFSVYGFLVARSQGFVEAIRRTEAMQRFNSQLGRAMIAGFVLTVISMTLIVLSPRPGEFGAIYVGLAMWFALFVWAFVAFLRVAYVFGLIVRVPDGQDLSV